MTDEQIEQLKAIFSSTKLYWIDSQNTVRQIISIDLYKDPIYNDDPDIVPEPAAFFFGGEYIDLYNCDPENIFIIKPAIE